MKNPPKKFTDWNKVEEFAHDKSALVEARVQYKQKMREHAGVLDSFLMNALKKEITELREDRNAQGENFKKLEGFVLKQLTKELNEFHSDKQAVVEQKVKLVRPKWYENKWLYFTYGVLMTATSVKLAGQIVD